MVAAICDNTAPGTHASCRAVIIVISEGVLHMSLLKAILEAQGGKLVEQLAGQHGVNSSQATDAIRNLLPAIAGGMKRNTQQAGGLESLLNAVKNGNHTRYLDDANQITQPAAINDGNKILGHILGSKDVSRAVASRAAEQTGLDLGALKKMLPAVAAMAMGAMGKQNTSGGLLGQLAGAVLKGQQPDRGALGGLGALLDADNDGSSMDDLLGMAKKFL